MDWKQKIKWKLFVIFMALLGILVVWCAGKAGEKRSHAEQKILRENAIKENERADVFVKQESTEPKGETSKSGETEKKEEETIKVLLMTNGYAGYHHSNVTLKAQGDYEVQGSVPGKLLDGETMELHPGSQQLEGGNIKFLPLEAGSRLQILSLSRGDRKSVV